MGQVGVGGSEDSSIRVVTEERTKRSKEELRELWRKAILQQILLQRMEMENQKLQGEWHIHNRAARYWKKTLTLQLYFLQYILRY